MKYAVDTSVLIDHLRGHQAAVELVAQLVNDDAEFVSSFVIRAEVLAGMRPGEERRTRLLLDLIEWDPVAEPESEAAGTRGEVPRSTRPTCSWPRSPSVMVRKCSRRTSSTFDRCSRD